MNKLVMLGRICNNLDLEVKKKVKTVKFTIAVSNGKDRESDFFQFISFNNQADFLHKYCHKGDRILIEGKIKNNNYTNSNNQKVYQNSLIANQIYFADGKKVNNDC